MPTAEYRLYFDNAAAAPNRIGQFAEIRVDQAAGVAAQAELQLPVETDPGGLWSGQEEDFVQPFKRVRIEVKVGEGGFVPLIDGPIVANRFELKAAPGESVMTVVVHDDSVLLNREEKVVLFEDKAAHEIAETLITEYGLESDVDTTQSSGAALTRFVVQRGTNMQLLRQLARQYGMLAYVRPGASPGTSIGVFARPKLNASNLPEILLLGRNRNVASFSVALDALRPFRAKAASIAIADKQVLNAETESSDLPPLGEETAHDIAREPATTLLIRAREEQGDIDAATQAAVNLSSWGFRAEGEIDMDLYSGILTPYQVVSVAGAGGYLSGNYFISRVTHRLSDASYRQQFALVRNARSGGAGGGLPAIPGGLF